MKRVFWPAIGVLCLSLAIVPCATGKVLKKRGSGDEISAWLDSTVVTLVARETPIVEVVRLLPCSVRFEDIGKPAEKTVTANLYDVTLREALDAITQQGGLGYEAVKKGLVRIYRYKDLSYTLPVTPVSENYSATMGDMGTTGSSSDNGTSGGVDSALSAATGATSGSSPGSSGSTSSIQGGTSLSLTHSSTVAIWDILEKNLKSLVADDGNVVVDPRSSVVFVRCPAPMIGAVENYMGTILDALLVSVQVEITIVDVSKTDNKEIGLDWNMVLDQISLDNKISVVATGASSFLLEPIGAPFSLTATRSHGAETQTAVLKALRNYTNIKVVEQTTLSLRNNTATTIRRGTNIPYIDSIATTLASETSQTSVQKSSVLSGVDIGVMANVFRDLVSLSLTPKVCDLLSMETVDAGDTTIQNPYTRVRENLIQVLLKDNQTALIVGARNDRQGYEGQGIPGLSRLPVIGALFGDKTTYNENGYVVILVTPHVIRVAA